VAFDIVSACTTAGAKTCGQLFQANCFPDPANCGIGDSTILGVAEYQQLIPSIALVLGLAFVIRTVIQLMGVRQ
jgi:hypothetical protein